MKINNSINLILQTDSNKEVLQKYGCYLFSIIYITLHKNWHKLSNEHQSIFSFADHKEEQNIIINKIFYTLKEKALSNREAFLFPNGSNIPDVIYSVIMSMRTYQKGCSGISYTNTHSDIVSYPDGYVIGCFEWKFKHFVILNGIAGTKNDVIYDPLGRSYSVENGSLISTRLYKSI